MDFFKLVTSNGSYVYHDASNIEMEIIGSFLKSDVRDRIKPYRDWALHDTYPSIGGNLTDLEKENGIIYLRDLYSQEEVPSALKMTILQFVQILDEWEDKVCKKKPKEVVIKHDQGNFWIETQD